MGNICTKNGKRMLSGEGDLVSATPAVVHQLETDHGQCAERQEAGRCTHIMHEEITTPQAALNRGFTLKNGRGQCWRRGNQ